MKMNPYIPVEESEGTTAIQTAATDIDILTQCGFSAEQVVSLRWLQQRYQHGGSDRASFMRHLEFLKYLVMSGRMEK